MTVLLVQRLDKDTSGLRRRPECVKRNVWTLKSDFILHYDKKKFNPSSLPMNIGFWKRKTRLT